MDARPSCQTKVRPTRPPSRLLRLVLLPQPIQPAAALLKRGRYGSHLGAGEQGWIAGRQTPFAGFHIAFAEGRFGGIQIGVLEPERVASGDTILAIGEIAALRRGSNFLVIRIGQQQWDRR